MASLRESRRRSESGDPANGERSVDIQFTMAFQPIIDLDRQEVFAFEALARGVDGESAATVFSRVRTAEQYAFDQSCRTKAIRLAGRLGMNACLSLNFLPNAIYHPGACIGATLIAARQARFPVERIIFEITESEPVADVTHLAEVIRDYRRQGFRIAIDDFGAGYSGLSLLADLRPDFVKLDFGLIHAIDTDRVRHVLVDGITATCRALSIGVIAEGVETPDELKVLRSLGVRYVQGYLFARPKLESLPEVQWPECQAGPSSGDTKIGGATQIG
jgi:EAL domain-containing protein (putative c-di-GMP-specific phosphodiesterase class I)